jgi:hypothetical protein
VTIWLRSFSRYEKTLLFLFLLTLPFVHPAVEGDGVGYYAYLRSPLIDHNFQFSSDFKDPKNELLSIYLDKHFIPNPITKTGHLPNFYSVGPAILWLPFVAITHVVVLTLNHFGWNIAADGHSRPYVVVLCFATALYGFLGLWISFRLARKYVDEPWAFWATLAIWLASSLPLFLYLYPSWSHAHSVFCASLFLWYWDRTRGTRRPAQWLILGLLSGLMVDVYSANSVFLLAPGIEAAYAYLNAWRKRVAGLPEFWSNLRLHILYAAGVLLALLPTFIAREIIYGNPFAAGVYADVRWRWAHPMFRAVLFDTSHGLFVCTPILLLALVGLCLLARRRPEIGGPCLAISLAFYVLISLYPWWFGSFGFGNRFFVSLTPIFILGLSFLFSESVRLWGTARAASRRLLPVTMILILWNLGLVYQWSVDMFPWRSQVYWDEVLYDQFHVVPQQAFRDLRAKFSPRAEPGDSSSH